MIYSACVAGLLAALLTVALQRGGGIAENDVVILLLEATLCAFVQ